MNAIEILGLACVDAKFRERLFGEVDSVILDNKVDLTWAEEAGLRRITGKTVKVRRDGKAHSPDAGIALTSSDPSEAEEKENQLKKELKDVGDTIMMMWCPEVPCAWPSAFIQNKPEKKPKP
jgi:hypothetical protein